MQRLIVICLAFVVSCTSAVPPRQAGTFEEEYASQPRLPGDRAPNIEALLKAVEERERARARRPFGVAPAADLTWTSMGPENFAGRVMALLTDPDSPKVLWAGTWAGLWKSENAGVSWQFVDFFLGKLVRVLERHPSDPAVLYAGTGWYYQYAPPSGGAVYKSTDGGASWTPLPGVDPVCGVSGLSISPADPATILMAQEHGPGCGGLYRSADGGETWTRVLASAVALGQPYPATRVQFDPFTPTRAVAAVGTSSGVTAFYSNDAGLTWTPAAGIDPAFIGMCLALAPTAPGVVYAAGYDSTGYGIIWRSDDGGTTFRRTSGAPPAGFFAQPGLISLWVSPDDPDFIVIGNQYLWRSRDGGVTLEPLSDPVFAPASNPHQDVTAIVQASDYDLSSNPKVFLATDGGVYQTYDIRTATVRSGWTGLPKTMQNAMYYDIAVTVSGDILGGMQDTGTSLTSSFSASSQQLNNGDSFVVAADPVDARRYYRGHGTLWRCDYPATCRGVGPPEGMAGAAFALDPTNRDRMFAASRAIYRSTNISSATPPTWTTIRPAGTYYFKAIAVDPGDANVVWAGDGLGNLYRSTNALSATPSWTHINTAVKGGVSFPGGITRIVLEAKGSVYVCTGWGHLLVSDDGGLTWQNRSGDATARLPLNIELWSVAVHPSRSTLLFAATRAGMYTSEDRGGHWYPMGGVPGKVPVMDVLFYRGTNRLVAATHGRGLWYTDVSP